MRSLSEFSPDLDLTTFSQIIHWLGASESESRSYELLIGAHKPAAAPGRRRFLRSSDVFRHGVNGDEVLYQNTQTALGLKLDESGSVNLGCEDFLPQCAHRIQALLELAKLPGATQRLVLEVVESVPLTMSVKNRIKALRGAGYEVWLDDFNNRLCDRHNLEWSSMMMDGTVSELGTTGVKIDCIDKGVWENQQLMLFTLEFCQQNPGQSIIFEGLSENQSVYFLHTLLAEFEKCQARVGIQSYDVYGKNTNRPRPCSSPQSGGNFIH